MSIIFILLAMLALAHAASFTQVLDKEWLAFTKNQGKRYRNAAEKQFRYRIFNENRIKIAEHNRRFAKGEVSFKMATNEYSDLKSQEFSEMMTGLSYSEYEARSLMDEGLTFISPKHVTLPTSVDWRSKGAVTEVKSQGKCGSCWAFSTTGSLEGQHFRKTGQLVPLSEQNLVDCSGGSYLNHGCRGGLMTKAFKYIRDNGGIDTNDSYPYKAVDDECKFNKTTIGATVTGFVALPAGDERKLAEAVATIGPISVAINVPVSFQHYRSGIYIEPYCNPKLLNHAVLVVGYGTEGGRDFWLVKNSWRSTWGDKGYIKMLRNGNNMCGISSLASYPTV